MSAAHKPDPPSTAHASPIDSASPFAQAPRSARSRSSTSVLTSPSPSVAGAHSPTSCSASIQAPRPSSIRTPRCSSWPSAPPAVYSAGATLAPATALAALSPSPPSCCTPSTIRQLLCRGRARRPRRAALAAVPRYPAPEDRNSPFEQLPQQVDREVPPLQAPHFSQKLARKDRDFGLVETRRLEDVDDTLGSDGPRDDLADGMVQLLPGRVSPLARLPSTDRLVWKNASSSRIRVASSWGTASANAWERSRTARI